MILDYFLTGVAALAGTASRASSKLYNKKQRYGGIWYFNFVVCAAAALFFAVYFSIDSQFNAATLIYSAIFLAGYIGAVIFTYLAVTTGPLALSSLIISFSMIVPTVYGFIFWEGTGSAFVYAGFAAAALSIVLVNANIKSEKTKNETVQPAETLPLTDETEQPPANKDGKISFKWLCFALISFLANGFCAVVQREHQREFPGAFRAEFMLFAMLPAALFFLAFFLITRPKAGETQGARFKPNDLILPVFAGVINGLYNLLLTVLASSAIPPAVLYPLLAVGGVVISCAVSVFFFKERFTLIQYAGIAAGLASVVLLNL